MIAFLFYFILFFFFFCRFFQFFMYLFIFFFPIFCPLLDSIWSGLVTQVKYYTMNKNKQTPL